jgi:arylsulfatase
MFVNGEKVSAGRIQRTQVFIFSADEGADDGVDGETPVTDDSKEGDNKFTGKIRKVPIDIVPAKLGASQIAARKRADIRRSMAE